MKRFKFKFETVEKVRKSREEEFLKLLALAQKKFQEEIERKNKLHKDLESALIRRENAARANGSVVPIQMEDAFIIGTKQRLIQSQQAIALATRRVEKAMRGYLQARKQTMMMEKLREKALSDFKEQSSRAEQRQLDDLYVMRGKGKRDVA